MAQTVTQGALTLVRPDRPYEIALGSEQPVVVDDGKSLILMAGSEPHTLAAANAEAFVAKRVGGRHLIRGVRVAKRTKLVCPNQPDVHLAPGTWYVVEA